MTPSSFSLRRIAVSAFGPSLLFGLGEGAILPVIPLSARDLGASVAVAALMVTLIGIGSLVSNIPASLITMHRGERWAIVAAAVWCAGAMALSAWTDHLGVFALGCFMVGMSQAVFSLARQSYLTDAVPAEFRARAMSTIWRWSAPKPMWPGWPPSRANPRRCSTSWSFDSARSSGPANAS